MKILKRKKIRGAVWMLPDKQHSQSSPIWLKISWISCAIQQATSKRLTGSFFPFIIFILIYFFKYKSIETHAGASLPLNISAVVSVTTILEGIHTTNSPNLMFSLLFLGSQGCPQFQNLNSIMHYIYVIFIGSASD